MKKEIVVVNGNGEPMRVEALVLTHPHPTIGAVGFHKSLVGADKPWSATHVRSGRRFTQGKTRKGLVDEVMAREFTDDQLKIVAEAPDAPPMQEDTPPALMREARKRIDLDAIVDAVDAVVPLNERERKAVRDALSSRSGRLKAKAPVESWAKAAWNGLQPNPWKTQIGAFFFLPDQERALLDRLSKHTWPDCLDKDLQTLKRFGVA